MVHAYRAHSVGDLHLIHSSGRQKNDVSKYRTGPVMSRRRCASHIIEMPMVFPNELRHDGTTQLRDLGCVEATKSCGSHFARI